MVTYLWLFIYGWFISIMQTSGVFLSCLIPLCLEQLIRWKVAVPLDTTLPAHCVESWIFTYRLLSLCLSEPCPVFLCILSLWCFSDKGFSTARSINHYLHDCCCWTGETNAVLCVCQRQSGYFGTPPLGSCCSSQFTGHADLLLWTCLAFQAAMSDDFLFSYPLLSASQHLARQRAEGRRQL